jgi:hypothetical protein
MLTAGVVLAYASTPFAAAQTPAPSPATPAPIVVPTLAPDGPNANLIRAAVGVVEQLLAQQRTRNANNAYGTVTYFQRFEMQVRTGTNAYRTIHLHVGTVINPRGGTPGVGTTVSVNGDGQADGSLNAATITIQH